MKVRDWGLKRGFSWVLRLFNLNRLPDDVHTLRGEIGWHAVRAVLSTYAVEVLNFTCRRRGGLLR